MFGGVRGAPETNHIFSRKKNIYHLKMLSTGFNEYTYSSNLIIFKWMFLTFPFVLVYFSPCRRPLSTMEYECGHKAFISPPCKYRLKIILKTNNFYGEGITLSSIELWYMASSHHSSSVASQTP
jgi:hypothetical protein